MSDLLIDGIRVSFSGPQSLPLAVVTRGNPAYDGPRSYFTLTLKNESDRPRSLPFDEISRNTVRVYGNPATRAQVVDNRAPPPKLDGEVEPLAPGGAKSFQIVFAYPAGIATMNQGVADLRFCAKWEAAWLRSTSYQAGSYDWNASFQLCRNLRIEQ